MRLMTLNAHSIIEKGYPQKCEYFVDRVCQLRPDIIALQEVNQSSNAPSIPTPESDFYAPCQTKIPFKADNHILRVVEMLAERGLAYHFAWLPIKVSYDRFDEGVALLSLSPITKTYVCQVSLMDEFSHWKTRKALGITTKAHPHTRFYTTHMGWWQDPEEPFPLHWQNTISHLDGVEDVVIAGDFNSPAEVRGEGYDLVAGSGFHDVYDLAMVKIGSVTVPTDEGSIDGWHDIAHPKNGMRIDQIWTRKPHAVSEYRVLFDGIDSPVVSDHFGVLVDMEIDDALPC